MKILSLLLLAPLSLMAATTPPVSTEYQHISNVWLQPNSTFPDCTAAITTSCLDTSTLSLTAPVGNTIIVTVPNGGIPAGGQVSYLWGPGGFLYCGSWQISVVANYKDSSGASVSSSADTASANVPCPLVANPATGLTSTPAP